MHSYELISGSGVAFQGNGGRPFLAHGLQLCSSLWNFRRFTKMLVESAPQLRLLSFRLVGSRGKVH